MERITKVEVKKLLASDRQRRRRRPPVNPLEEIFERLGKLETREDVQYLDQQQLTQTRNRVSGLELRVNELDLKAELALKIPEENGRRISDLLRAIEAEIANRKRSLWARIFG